MTTLNSQLSSAEMKAVEQLGAASLGQEAFEIIRALPPESRGDGRGGYINKEALNWASLTYQETSSLERAVGEYLALTGRILLGNSFSLNMLDEDVELLVCSIDVAGVKDLIKNPRFRGSVVGHQDTANIYSQLLGIDVKSNRESVTLNRGDTLLVGQYSGPRLPEGSTSLPEGAKIKWLIVRVK